MKIILLIAETIVVVVVENHFVNGRKRVEFSKKNNHFTFHRKNS